MPKCNLDRAYLSVSFCVLKPQMTRLQDMFMKARYYATLRLNYGFAVL